MAELPSINRHAAQDGINVSWNVSWQVDPASLTEWLNYLASNAMTFKRGPMVVGMLAGKLVQPVPFVP